VRNKVPETPAIVTVAVPVVALALAESVIVVLLVAGFGLKAAVTPAGKPDAENVTLPLNPFSGSITTVLVALFPCATLTLFGLANSL
jgi:hypothetical protein